MSDEPTDKPHRLVHPYAPTGEDSLSSFLLMSLDAAGELMLIRGRTGRVVHVNRAFLNAFGGELTDWVGRWFSVAPPVSEGQSRRYEILMRTRSGPLWIEWDERCLGDSQGVIAVGRDITSRREKHDNLEASQKAKSAFFAAVTHELRTPLAGAMGMARLLGGTPLRPDQADYVRSLAASAEHALTMIDDILDLSRLEAGRLVLRPENTNIGALVRETIELIAPRAQEKSLEIAVVHAAGAPSLVEGDAARLKQILYNLAGNAVKFTDKGGVRIDIDNAPDAEGRARLALSVSDTGPGISEDDQASLFEQFERGAAEREGREEGAGIGLAMVRRLVEAMGSTMGVESELGAGSKFWIIFELPVLDNTRETPLAGRKLAVASPDATLRQALADQLEALGGSVLRIAKTSEIPKAEGCELLIDRVWAKRKDAKRAAKIWQLMTPAEKETVTTKEGERLENWFVKPVRRATLIAQLTGKAETVRHVRTEANDGTPDLTGYNILIAEDDPVNALIARRTVEKSGARVEVVDSGHGALQALEGKSFDAILLDQRMPGMDGPEFARMARLNGYELPIIALTANSTEEDRQRCLDAGMDDFLTKPLDPERLFDTLERLCTPENRSSLG